MKRVLNVISTLEQGGTEAVVLNYFNHIDSEKVVFDFLVIWGEKEGYYEDYLRSKGCRIFKMKNPPNRYFAHGEELKWFFKANKYDIVHIHAMSSLRYRVAKAAKKAKTKTVIYHSHNSSNEKHLLIHKMLKNRLNKWCDYKFACSEIAGKFMYNGDFKVINNAIDIERFSYNENIRNGLREKYKIKNQIVIGNIGRLSEVKNQQFLLKVAKQLKNNIDSFIIVCVGEGSERSALRQLVNDNGLYENVALTGTVGSEVYKYYSMFDVLAFPSHYEGLSMVLIEAQANGLPIVASDKITSENKVGGNFTFLPIDENEENYKKWAETILSVIGKRQNNAKALADKGFDIKSEAKKLQEFYLSE